MVINYAFKLADQIDTFSANDALVIGAFLTPVLSLTGYVIKHYVDYYKDKGRISGGDSDANSPK